MRKDGSDTTANISHRIPTLPFRPVMLAVYRLMLFLYRLTVMIAAPFNDKAKKWVSGRKLQEEDIAALAGIEEKRIWVHCSSMGEFEQAKPLIELMRAEFSRYKIVVTFFSPSGYDACKNSPLADHVFYLPHDSKRNAGKFISAVNPALALFVKYEFWYHYLVALKRQNIHVLLVSGAFRKEQVFFKWYGGLFRDMLRCFDFFFLQDRLSVSMINNIGIHDNVLISGDTRYDRVSAIASRIKPITAVELFKGTHKILIAGSTWPGDESVLRDCLDILPDDWKLILVPHEIGDAHIRKIQELFNNEPVLYTELDAEHTGHDKRILVVNNMGMLSRIFAYGDVAFIGGGFQKGGIHNILEPAVFGLPVVFGPVYQKFVEARELAGLHYVFPVSNSKECREILTKLFASATYRQNIGDSLKKFMQEHTGAARAILDVVKREQWLG